MTTGRSHAVARAGAAALRTRWLVRSPIWLYRAGLGLLFGHRMLMLEHVGRTTGHHRYVVLEVVDHPEPGRWIVSSGFGARSQWFRNIQANPGVRIWIASHKPAQATAQRLDADAAAASLGRFAADHPRYWARLRPVLKETLGAPVGQRADELPMVALDLVERG